MISSRSCETCIVFILLLVRKLIFFDIKILTLKNKNKLAQSAKVLIQIRWKLLEEKTRINYKINTRRKVLRHFPIRPNICIKLRIYWAVLHLIRRGGHIRQCLSPHPKNRSHISQNYIGLPVGINARSDRTRLWKLLIASRIHLSHY